MAGKHSADSKYSYDSNDDRNNYEEPKYDYSNYENLNNNVNDHFVQVDKTINNRKRRILILLFSYLFIGGNYEEKN